MTDKTDDLCARLDKINRDYDLARGIHVAITQAATRLREQEAEIAGLRAALHDCVSTNTENARQRDEAQAALKFQNSLIVGANQDTLAAESALAKAEAIIARYVKRRPSIVSAMYCTVDDDACTFLTELENSRG